MKQRAKQLICTLLMAVMVMGYLLPLTAEASTDCPWITNCEQLTLRIDAENRVDSDGGISKVTTENKCDDKNCKDFVGQQNKVCNERINAVSSSRSRQAACNHTYAYVTTKAATCTQDGRQTYQCTKCGLVNTQAPGKTIPKLGHNMKRVTTKQPTCGATGTYVTKCTRCGVGDPNGNGSIAATGNHNWTLKSTTAATCVADGKKVFKCSVCGQSKTETLAKLGHSWNMSSANCTTAKKCTRCGTIGQNALGHSYQTIITKDATCGAQGTYTTKCIRCGAAGSGGYIAPTGNHKWNRNESSCTEAKKCTVCGTVAEAAKGHTWNLSSSNCTTDKKCTRCGTVSQKALGHSWNLSSPNCTTDKKCTRCGSIAQKALGHDYKTVTTKNPTCGAQGTYVIQCTRCKAQNGSGYINPTGNHVWNRNAATCLEAKKCTVCGTVGEAAKGHIWNVDRATCVVTKKCTACGAVAENALGHNYKRVVTQEAGCETIGFYVTKCEVCGEGCPDGNGTIAPTGHVWTPKDFNCTEDRTCTLCGKVSVAPGHDYKTYVIKEPGCVSQGIYEIRCSVCDHYYGTGYIQPTGEHTWNYNTDNCTKTCQECGLIAVWHDYTRITRKGDYECQNEMVDLCTNCGLEIVREVNHIAFNHKWPASRIDGDNCEIATVWRKCPYCNEVEYKDPEEGTAHILANGICTLCGKNMNSEAFLLIGDDYKSAQDNNKLINAISFFLNPKLEMNFSEETNLVQNLLVDSDEYTNVKNLTYKALTEIGVLGYLSSTTCFSYSGHGGVDPKNSTGYLAVSDKIKISADSIKDLDLSNMDVACVVSCDTANGKETAADNPYEGSIAYALCERGAKVSIGCAVPADWQFCHDWIMEFFNFYPTITKKADEITDKKQRDDFISDSTYCLAMAVTQYLVQKETRRVSGDKTIDENKKIELINMYSSFCDSIVVFTRETKLDENGDVLVYVDYNTYNNEIERGRDFPVLYDFYEGQLETINDYIISIMP